MVEVKNNDILKLSDGKKYIVCCTIDYKDSKYLYLVDENDTRIFKICLLIVDENGGEIEEIEDKETLDKIMPVFSKRAEELLKEVTEQN
jgi:hypothetical protein